MPLRKASLQGDATAPAPLGHWFGVGLGTVWRHFGLVVLLYAVNLGIALALSWPVYTHLDALVSETGYSSSLTREFDFMLWLDILEHVGDALGGWLLHLVWIVPCYLLWRVAAAMGVIYAARGEGSFAQGVKRYIGKGLLLTLPFVGLQLGWFVLVANVVQLLGRSWPGEVGLLWTGSVLGPALLVLGCAAIDLMQDYARIILVVEKRSVWQAWQQGLRWPWRWPSVVNYIAWLIVALGLWALPTLLDARLATYVGPVIWAIFAEWLMLILFGLQQAVLLLRAAATVGWIGSEVGLYEAYRTPRVLLLGAGADTLDRDEAPV